jgi:hypothetical protein
MSGELLLVGKAPNSDGSVVDRAYVGGRWGEVKVDLDYVNEQASLYSINMVDTHYVDAGDSGRAKRVDVDAADALYVLKSDKGVVGGVATIGSDGYIPDAQLGTVQTDRIPTYVNGTIILSGTKTVTTTLIREYVAGTLEIADPGYDYVVLPFAQIQAAPILAVPPATPMTGTPNYGKIAIVGPAPTNEVFSQGICSGAAQFDFYTSVPYALKDATPLNVPPRQGDLNLDLCLSLFSGNTYSFSSLGIMLYAFVYPAG